MPPQSRLIKAGSLASALIEYLVEPNGYSYPCANRNWQARYRSYCDRSYRAGEKDQSPTQGKPS
jgi:hypothetical protein